SFLIAAGTFGSFVASASWTLTSPFSIWTDFTRPNETISRVKPGYFTDFKAFFTCSSEIDISELTRDAREVNRTLIAEFLKLFLSNLERRERDIMKTLRFRISIVMAAAIGTLLLIASSAQAEPPQRFGRFRAERDRIDLTSSDLRQHRSAKISG